MYRVFNYLFGWDYVVVIAPVMGYRYTLKVHRNKNAGCYVIFAGSEAWFLNADGRTDNGYFWKALTF